MAFLACHAPLRAPPTAKLSPSILTSHLPLPLLVRTARAVWHAFWRVQMAELAPSDAAGRYKRPKSSRTPHATPRPLPHSASPHLYVGVACQWCHRVTLTLALLNDHQPSPVHVCQLQPGDDGLWRLPDQSRLKDVYLSVDSDYNGRFTAPLLLGDAAIVSNESSEMIHMLPGADRPREVVPDVFFWLRPSRDNPFAVDVDLLHSLCEQLYECVNDGVYRCGFATSQFAYEEAQTNLFNMLDCIEQRLTTSRFVCSGNCITEADVRLFPTVFRFDAVYAVLFKACRKNIRSDYPAISDWLRDMYNLPGVKQTCDLEATRDNYYTSLFPLNPSAIVAVTAQPDLSPAPHRAQLGVPSRS